MGLFDGIGNAWNSLVDAGSEAVHAVGDAISNGADAVGSAAQSGLDGARDWVDENMGAGFWGDVARGAIDVAKVGVGLAEFGVNVLGIGLGVAGDVLGDVLTGDFGAIPGHLQEGWDRIQEEWQEYVDQVATYAIKSSKRGRDVSGTAKESARSWSMAGGIALNRAGFHDPRTYKDTGKRYEFELREGRVWFREVTMTCAEPAWRKLVYREGDAEGTRISFDNDRTGSEREAPLFEMIVASADRVFVKEKDKDHFYFLLMDELFWGLRSLDPSTDEDMVETLKMPSNYFKIDPEKNLPGARAADLLVAVSGTLPKIPQAERIPLFREVMRMGIMEMMVKVKPRLWYRIDCRSPLFGAQPPDDVPTYAHVRYGSRLLNGWNPVPDVVQRSIDFEHVLDIGVGNMHFHEQWTAVNGGEMQALFVQNIFNVLAYTLTYALMNGPVADGDGFCDGTCNFYLLVRLRTKDKVAEYAIPEPLDDLIMGTGRSSTKDEAPRYGILWCDEQSLFTQRWRLADVEDNEWVEQSVSPTRMKLNFSLASALDNSRDGHLHAFRKSQVWSPFRNGHINEHSRMTVSRQVIVVNGVDPHTGEHELYSTNFSYGTADRTWRWRGFSAQGLKARYHPVVIGKADTGPGQKDPEANVVYPHSLHLREDMTLSVQGTATGSDGRTLNGYWVQSYLPASHRHVPSAEEHAATNRGNAPTNKPSVGYSHPWQFWTAEAFKLADRFSHFGVYAPVDARTQYYSIDVLTDALMQDGGEWDFIDAPDTVTIQLPTGPVQAALKGPELGQLYIKGRKVNYEKLGELLGQDPATTISMILQLLVRTVKDSTRTETWKRLFDDILFKWENSPRDVQEADAQFRASRRSMYNFHGRFKILKRGPLGWIAVWTDKRDDDLMSLSDLPMEVSLSDGRSTAEGLLVHPERKVQLPIDPVRIPKRECRVRFNAHHTIVRPPSVRKAWVRSQFDHDGIQRIHIGFTTDLSRHEMDRNIWSVHLGALHCQVSSFVVRILDAVVTDAMSMVSGESGSFEGAFEVPAPHSSDIGMYISSAGREQYGTSLWFEGPTGLVAVAEETQVG